MYTYLSSDCVSMQVESECLQCCVSLCMLSDYSVFCCITLIRVLAASYSHKKCRQVGSPRHSSFVSSEGRLVMIGAILEGLMSCAHSCWNWLSPPDLSTLSIPYTPRDPGFASYPAYRWSRLSLRPLLIHGFPVAEVVAS